MASKSYKTQRRASYDADPVTAYALDVHRGRIVAGPHVRDACARHLRDLDAGAARGLAFDVEAALDAIAFYREVLCLNGGDFEGVPYELLPWQAFIVGSLFGWKVSATGFRRFRVAYVETGKGSGKSPLAAGIGLYGLVADGEARAEVYAAATKKDQAMILFRDAVAMVDLSPILCGAIERSGSKGKEWNLAYHEAHSFFRPIASDHGNAGQSGPRPHIALLDEIHEHRDGSVVEMLRAGTKGRKQALIFMITNSGTNKQTVCWEYHDYGAKLLAAAAAGAKPGDAHFDDSFFAYICALDEGEDPFKDRRCWIKANPSLGVTIQDQYLEEQITQARGMPAKEAFVRRLNFCQWVAASAPWISGHVWYGAADESFDDELLQGRRCWGGLDLSSTQDLTAFVLTFEPTEDDPFWRVVPWFWLPEDGLPDKADQDRVPYLRWVADGHLETTPGKAVSRRHVMGRLVSICERYNVQGIAYDDWRIADLLALMADEGITLPGLIPFRQGFKSMGPAVDEFERRLINGEVRHMGNPVLTWNAANAVTVMDPAGNRKLAKDKATGRMDGIICAVMAAGISTGSEAEAAIDDFLMSPIIV